MFYEEDNPYYLEKKNIQDNTDTNDNQIELNSDERYKYFGHNTSKQHNFHNNWGHFKNNWGHSNYGPGLKPFYPYNNSNYIPQNIFPCSDGKYSYNNGQNCYFNAAGYPFVGMANHSMPTMASLISTPIVTKRASELFD